MLVVTLCSNYPAKVLGLFEERLSVIVLKMAEVKKMVDFEGSKVVVTGGGGYFGCRLGRALRDKGADVVLFDIREPENLTDLTFYKVSYI